MQIEKDILESLEAPHLPTALRERFGVVSHVAPGREFSITSADADDFWRHAFYAATYAQRLTELLPAQQGLDPQTSYDAGLFHNIGLLWFSQLFPPEYKMLKKWLQLNPNVSISVLEQRLLGMGHAFHVLRGGHTQLGEWLLRQWQMPEVICVIAREHHSLSYKGEYETYVKIIQLTNVLLREQGIGDGSLGVKQEIFLQTLGLSADQVFACVQEIKNGAENIEQTARSLTKSAQL